MRTRYALAKRALDVMVAGIGLVVTLPVTMAVAVLIGISMGRPVFFRQERIGLDAVPFTILKFRSMLADRPDRPDAERLTRLGSFLRSSSLDEIPTLWNVLRGDMSLVGPRPLLPEYLPLYSRVQARRHEVRPGVTGWAQVNGRNRVDWEERLAMDVWYVENQSMVLDLKILRMTLLKVIRRDGISQDGHATMEKFRGGA